MSNSSETYHEPIERLSAETIELHRALVSLREELEATDWYRQRADACADESLRGILRHNMREEIEHASMLLEWLRRSDADFDENLATYLFTTGRDIADPQAQGGANAAVEKPDEPAEAMVADPPARGASSEVPPRLTIGSLKEKK